MCELHTYYSDFLKKVSCSVALMFGFFCCDKSNYMRRLNVLTQQIICFVFMCPFTSEWGKKGEEMYLH